MVFVNYTMNFGSLKGEEGKSEERNRERGSAQVIKCIGGVQCLPTPGCQMEGLSCEEVLFPLKLTRAEFPE